jgi:hypothetical protein
MFSSTAAVVQRLQDTHMFGGTVQYKHVTHMFGGTVQWVTQHCMRAQPCMQVRGASATVLLLVRYLLMTVKHGGDQAAYMLAVSCAAEVSKHIRLPADAQMLHPAQALLS